MLRLTVMPPKRGPGSFSTMRHEMPSSVRTASATMPARSPFVTHIFVPVTTYSSPSSTARHARLRVSLPASASESDRQPRSSPRRHARQPALLLLLGAVVHDQVRGDRVRVDDARQRHPAVRELLDHADVREEVETEAAVRLGNRDPEQPEPLHLLDDRLRIGVGVLHLGCDRHHLAGDEPPHRLDELPAYLGIGAVRVQSSCGAL